MAHEIFKAISNLRMALDTETDRDSPDNETTYGAIRSRVEYLMQILLGTGFDGTVTGIATTTITHAEGAQGIDEHNGRTTIITSGIAKGFFYTIDDGAAQTLIHTGDDLEADGVAVNDTFVVLYDIMTNVGHTHDDIDSPNVVLADGSIATAKYINESVTMPKIESGTLHALPIHGEQDGLEVSTQSLSFVDVLNYRVYIPASATAVRGMFRLKIASGQGAFARIQVGGVASGGEVTTTDPTYVWLGETTDCDVSALSGWKEFSVQLKTNNAGIAAFLKGFSIRWTA